MNSQNEIAAAAGVAAQEIRITGIEPFILHVPVTGAYIADSMHTLTQYWGLVGVVIHTDAGLCGYGYTGTHGTPRGRPVDYRLHRPRTRHSCAANPFTACSGSGGSSITFLPASGWAGLE